MSDICGPENSLVKSIDAGDWDSFISFVSTKVDTKTITHNIQRVKERLQNTTRKLKFKCKVCNKGFAQKRVLDTHMVIHTGEKPFSCKICKQTFSFGTQLRRHKLQKH